MQDAEVAGIQHRGLLVLHPAPHFLLACMPPVSCKMPAPR
jgi:hypothetical protein